ncbi:MAG TPA: hypothetical protein VH247_04255 [Thermoleophilaceae bacterium]|nr:hypothetical protein [Thermoleophilaceae bacterium]
MRRIAVAVAATAALALGTSTTASASTPGCFGHFVGFFTQNPPEGASNLGEFVSETASAPGSFGQEDIPFYKSLACG